VLLSENARTVLHLTPYLTFFLKNYLRSHRYLREIVFLVVFHIFFWGFLYGNRAEDAIWTVFGVLALLLNLVTGSSLFFLEKGNDLYFSLIRPFGRIRFFLAKVVLIVFIDLAWVLFFALIYGVRFPEGNYFLLLPVRMALILLLLALSTLLISFSFTYRPYVAWLILLLLVFGSILNKTALFPPSGLREAYVLLTLLLPPFLEIIFTAVSLRPGMWQSVFLLVAAGQIGLYLWLNLRFLRRKDFID